MSNIIQHIESQMMGAGLGRMKSGWREILPSKIMLVEQKMLNKEIWLDSTGKGQE